MESNGELYTNLVGIDHRKSMGQFFTPPKVAKFMVDWVLDSDIRQIYDPAFGLGAFFDATDKYPNLTFVGSDIDKGIIDFWRKGNENIEIRNEDYLQTWGNKWSNIVCNPPYMKFQKFINREKIREKFRNHLGIRLSGYMNTASAFLLKSIYELKKPGGRLAYIMPLEFLNTGYGRLVKEHLVKDKHLVAIMQLKCENDIFPDATTSIGIILYDSSCEHEKVNFHVLSSSEQLHNDLSKTIVNKVPFNNLNSNFKWLSFFQSKKIRIKNSLFVSLKNYGNFKRGIATGSNEFFVLTPSKADKMCLSASNFIPCITKSFQINSAVFDESDYKCLVKTDSPVLLFNGSGNNNKESATYIQHGISNGFHKRYLTKNRNPWYKIENREPAPILFNVFSRNGYKVILNNTKAVHLTCYHGFYPNIFGSKYVERLFIYLFSEAGRTVLSLSKRQYGNDLDKFEPNDLNNALVPAFSVMDGLSDGLVNNALSSIKRNKKLPFEAEYYFKKTLLDN